MKWLPHNLKKKKRKKENQRQKKLSSCCLFKRENRRSNLDVTCSVTRNCIKMERQAPQGLRALLCSPDDNTRLRDSTDGARTHGKSDMSVRIGEDHNQRHETVCWNQQMIHLCWVILALLSVWSMWVATVWAYFHHHSITLKFLDNVIGAPILTRMNVQKLWAENIRETSSHLTWAVLFSIFFFQQYSQRELCGKKLQKLEIGSLTKSHRGQGSCGKLTTWFRKEWKWVESQTLCQNPEDFSKMGQSSNLKLTKQTEKWPERWANPRITQCLLESMSGSL